MLRRITGLFDRYEAGTVEAVGEACDILDPDGKRIGRVEAITFSKGRLTASGWADARAVRLGLSGAEANGSPSRDRPDVVQEAGGRRATGFEVTIPAMMADFRRGLSAGLSVLLASGDTVLVPIRPRLPLTRQIASRLAFLRDALACLPAYLRWLRDHDLRWRQQIKRRLRLTPPPVSRRIDGAIFAAGASSPASVTPDDPVVIVMPVYNAFAALTEALACLERNTDLPWHLILAEDCSTDPAVRPFLRAWCADPARAARTTLIENPQNLGFIGAVNRGLGLALARGGASPVVLLNSDALVPEGWLSRLIAPFARSADVASVTPASNDAEIFTVPIICQRNDLAPGQAEAIDKTARRLCGMATDCTAPTGVGFCMAVARSWLAKCDSLDTSFGRGYGEEVDWCCRIAAMGGRHLCTPGLFVEHRGGESFGGAEKQRLIAQNSALISARYPDYDARVAAFIAADPMFEARLALAIAWAGSRDPGRAVPVFLAHSMGGGAEAALQASVRAQLAAGAECLILRVGGHYPWGIELISPFGRMEAHCDTIAPIAQMLEALPRRRIIYSNGNGAEDEAGLPDVLEALLRPQDEAEVLFHDYLPLSPSFVLLDSDGVYRGPPVPPRADPAHRKIRPDGRVVELAAWQAAWHRFASRADLVVFSEDGAAQVRAIWPDLSDRIIVRPHQISRLPLRCPAPPSDAPVVLGVLGNIGAHKGAAIVSDLGRLLAREHKDIGLVLLGNYDPAFPMHRAVAVHGNYSLPDIPALVARYGITHWLIPSIWPETFCFTVHEALATGLPVLAFDLGAQGAAVRQAPNGRAIPLEPNTPISAAQVLGVLRDLTR